MEGGFKPGLHRPYGAVSSGCSRSVRARRPFSPSRAVDSGTCRPILCTSCEHDTRADVRHRSSTTRRRHGPFARAIEEPLYELSLARIRIGGSAPIRVSSSTSFEYGDQVRLFVSFLGPGRCITTEPWPPVLRHRATQLPEPTLWMTSRSTPFDKSSFVFTQNLFSFSQPFLPEEITDLITPGEKCVSVAPNGIWRVGERYPLRGARVPGRFGAEHLGQCGVVGERRQWRTFAGGCAGHTNERAGWEPAPVADPQPSLNADLRGSRW